MKLDNRIWIMYLILIFLLISNNVYALGISPARKVVEFESDLEETVEFKVINSEHKAMKVVIYVEEFEKDKMDILVNTPELVFAANEDEKTVSYIYKLPNKFKEPGTHEFAIVAREIPVDTAFSGTNVGASVAVEHQLRVNVPYPGKYATAELKIAETNNKNAVNFIVAINNFGTQQIVNAKGIIDIYGPTNEKITTIETGSVSIESGLRKEISAPWDAQVNPGKYYAKLTLVYDGEVAEYESVFQVGEANVKILDIYSKGFKLGQVAKFNILVENGWSEKIKDVYTDLLISEKGQEIGRFKSATEDIDSLAKQELTAYWDTAGVKVGEYDAKIALHYDDKVVEKDMKTKISLNSISFSGFTGAVVSDSSNKNLFIGIIVVLVLINVFWFVYFKIKNRKK